MELLVDIGNSRIKWSDRDRLLKGDSSAAETNQLQSMLGREWSQLQRPDSVWVSSVASEAVLTMLISWAKQTWNIVPCSAKTYLEQLGVVNGYDNPAQLGVDRWMSLLGARAVFNRALIVIDCGTATTIDAMDQNGRHMGGLILPGLRVMRESLVGNTTIPEAGESAAITYFAQDTSSGILSGTVLSTICLIERVAEILREQTGGEIICVLTGGSAEEIKDAMNMNFYHEPNLVLQGLALVARTNDL